MELEALSYRYSLRMCPKISYHGYVTMCSIDFLFKICLSSILLGEGSLVHMGVINDVLKKLCISHRSTWAQHHFSFEKGLQEGGQDGNLRGGP